jgi:hypothetical protein
MFSLVLFLLNALLISSGSIEKTIEIFVKNDLTDSSFCDVCLYLNENHDSQCHSIPQNGELVLNVSKSADGRLNVRCHMKNGLESHETVLRNGYILIPGVGTSSYRLSEHVKNEVHLGAKESFADEDDVLRFLHPKL